MTDFSLKYRAEAALTFSGLNSLADGSRVDSSAYDNTTNKDVLGSIKVKLAGSGAGATGTVRVEIKRSHDNTDFEDSLNTELVGVVQMNGTATVVAIFEGVALSPYMKVSILNNVGAALAASGNSGAIVGSKYTDA